MTKKTRTRTDTDGVVLRPLGQTDATSPAQASRVRRQIKLKKRLVTNARKLGSIVAICKASGVDRTTLYKWCREDREFDAAFEEARDAWGDVLEGVVLDRVINGTKKMVTSMGEVLGYDTIHSDRLTELALRARNRKYNERTVPETAIAGLTGAAERLAQRLHKIAEREEARELPERDK